MAKLFYRMYQNTINNEKTLGKFYARLVHTETLGLEQLAEHIAHHGTVYTEDVVLGVLKKFSSCLLEMLYDSKKVKIEGLGTFYLSAASTGAESVDEFSADNIKRIRVRFLPEQVKQKLSSTRLRSEVSLLNIANLTEVGDGSGSGSGGSGTGGSGSGGDDNEPVIEGPGE